MSKLSHDLEKWYQYALQIHSRHAHNHYDIYIFLLTLIERIAHRHVVKSNRLNKVILEIGTGGGEHIEYELPFIKEKQYCAIDINFEYVKIAKRYSYAKILNADACNLPFKKATFDSCIAIGVLEHVADLDKLYLQVKEVLKKNGDFFVVIPTNGSLCVWLFKFFISYIVMYLRGIKKPSWIWHYENVNSFKRIACFLEKHFVIEKLHSLPFKGISWFFSPFYYFHCKSPNTF